MGVKNGLEQLKIFLAQYENLAALAKELEGVENVEAAIATLQANKNLVEVEVNNLKLQKEELNAALAELSSKLEEQKHAAKLHAEDIVKNAEMEAAKLVSSAKAELDALKAEMALQENKAVQDRSNAEADLNAIRAQVVEETARLQQVQETINKLKGI